jgi:PilZ domain
MNKREFMRFDVGLKVEAQKDGKEYTGLVKDFSKNGLRVVFDDFKLDLNSPLELKIQRPGQDAWIIARAQAIWKTQALDKWNVGLKIKEIPPENKAEILEYGYLKWLKDIGII